MKSFQLSVRKKFLYLLHKYFTVILIVPLFWSLLGSMSTAGMGSMGEVGVPIGIKTLSLFNCEELSEFQSSFFMFKEDIGVQDTVPIGPLVVSKFLSGPKEGALKFSCSLVEFSDMDKFDSVHMGFLGQFSGKPICSPYTEKGTNDTKTTANKSNFIWAKIHFWFIVLSGGFIGIAIGLIIGLGIVYFTQNVSFTSAAAGRGLCPVEAVVICSGLYRVLTAGCRMPKKPLTGGINRAKKVNNATKLHDTATARIHLIQMDRPLFKSRYVAAVSGA